jgi:uncharacterized protein YgiM (DUF1202 family)
MKRLFLLFSLFSLITLRASAQESTAETIGDSINVRSDSTSMSQSLCTLPKGTRVDIVQDKFDWYKIRLPQSFKAYVATKYIDVIGTKKGKVNATNLNLRLAPSTDASVIGKTQVNDVVQIIGKEGDWYKLSAYPYGTGWINKKFVKVHKISPEVEALVDQLAVNDLPIRENAKKQLIAKGPQVITDLELYLNKDTDKTTAYGLIVVLGEITKSNKEAVKDLLKKVDNTDLLTAAMCLDIAQNAVSPMTRLPYYYCALQNKLDDKNLQTAKGYLSRVNSCSKNN